MKHNKAVIKIKAWTDTKDLRNSKDMEVTTSMMGEVNVLLNALQEGLIDVLLKTEEDIDVLNDILDVFVRETKTQIKSILEES